MSYFIATTKVADREITVLVTQITDPPKKRQIHIANDPNRFPVDIWSFAFQLTLQTVCIFNCNVDPREQNALFCKNFETAKTSIF